ncbi:aldo/keto reductase [Nocardia sp. NPDC057668]|uniref:aldo/keto reductase n=1 Tax=Nocardia sp. NPDC057668 TaxID=3346202 RepID=UPI00366F89CC
MSARPFSSRFLLGGDLPVKRIGFGALQVSSHGWQGPPRDPHAGRTVLRRAIELGVDHIDTADYYRSGDESVAANDLIRQALSPYPPELAIAVKVSPAFGPGGVWETPDGDLRSQVRANLRSLGVDRLDLVYLRAGTTSVPHGQSLAAEFEVLAELREAGLIRHLGLSNIDVGHLTEARAIAPVAAVQNHFQVIERSEDAVLAACEQADIAFVPFFPLGGHRTDHTAALADIADRHGATPTQIGLARLLALSPVTLAIPGTGSVAHLEENMGAASIVLTDEELAELGR